MPPLHAGSLVDGGAELELGAACGCGCDCDGTALSSTADDWDPNAPAESLRLRIGEDIDWSDVLVGAVAAVLERDDSTKGAAANPKCAARRSAAARSSLSAPAPAAAVVIGGLLPAAAGKAAARHGHHACRRRRSPCQLQLGLGGRARVFASGEAAAGGHHQSSAEPGSPKVSCLGGVRSQPRCAAEVITGGGGRRWWAWLVVPDVLLCRCWKGRRDRRRPRASEAE